MDKRLTNLLPTVPGVYWFKPAEDEPRICEVAQDHQSGELYLYFVGDSGGFRLNLAREDSLWIGPLSPEESDWKEGQARDKAHIARLELKMAAYQRAFDEGNISRLVRERLEADDRAAAAAAELVKVQTALREIKNYGKFSQHPESAYSGRQAGLNFAAGIAIEALEEGRRHTEESGKEGA